MTQQIACSYTMGPSATHSASGPLPRRISVEAGPEPRSRVVGEDERIVSRAQVGDEAARVQVLEGNLGLVFSVARKFHCPTMELEDLVQEGVIGLARAIDLFDADRGLRFSTYAVHWIRQAITRAIDNKARLIRMPVNAGYAAVRVQRAREELTTDLGRPPTVEEIAAEADVPARRVPRLLDSLCETVSLEGGPDGTSPELADSRTPTPEEATLVNVEQETVRQLVAALPEREQRVIQSRFGLGGEELSTLRQLADELAMTPQGVRRVEARALKHLRTAFASIE
jgi:RNA polymerase primary sigma factor